MIVPVNSMIALIPIFLGMMRQAASTPVDPVITAAPTPGRVVARDEASSHVPVFAADTTMTLNMLGLDQQGLYIHNEDRSYSKQDLGAFMPRIEYKFDADQRSKVFTAAFYDEAKVENAIGAPATMTETEARNEWFKTADRYAYTKEAPTKLYECTAKATEVRQDVQVTMRLHENEAPFAKESSSADFVVKCGEVE
ncbi:hypothetical protein I316_05604 [Kwoniella heveanensis BCC8398]|uniref:Uncharacterized protein n=1 Tax=Kwoniella heveanensis BCC8398 TaxID=1296120 RepID=A0A1B9GNV4_9TREE|nr:hypothetical protein I316_05604 [Kwoniella heveanensis BCC8398]